MELLILLVIVIVLCVVLGISLSYIVMGVAIVIGIISSLFTIAFWGCGICLLGTRRKEAKFLRIDKPQKGKFPVAFYLVEGHEYPCIFPREAVLENKFYQTDKVYHVMLHAKLGKVFDRFAVATSILGMVAGTILSVGIWYFLVG